MTRFLAFFKANQTENAAMMIMSLPEPLAQERMILYGFTSEIFDLAWGAYLPVVRYPAARMSSSYCHLYGLSSGMRSKSSSTGLSKMIASRVTSAFWIVEKMFADGGSATLGGAIGGTGGVFASTAGATWGAASPGATWPLPASPDLSARSIFLTRDFNAVSWAISSSLARA